MGIIYGIEELTERHEKYEVIKNDIIENVDVCIIGSGAAGAVLASISTIVDSLSPFQPAAFYGYNGAPSYLEYIIHTVL